MMTLLLRTARHLRPATTHILLPKVPKCACPTRHLSAVGDHARESVKAHTEGRYQAPPPPPPPPFIADTRSTMNKHEGTATTTTILAVP